MQQKVPNVATIMACKQRITGMATFAVPSQNLQSRLHALQVLILDRAHDAPHHGGHPDASTRLRPPMAPQQLPGARMGRRRSSASVRQRLSKP